MKVKNSKGFTLAEMLIVMGVAVVLAAAVIPSVSGQIEKARQSNDLMVIADAYADAYADAAVQAATAPSSGTKEILLNVTLQHTSDQWTLAHSIGGQKVPNGFSAGKTGLSAAFDIDSTGSIKFSAFTPKDT